jgi:hypothetical protein
LGRRFDGYLESPTYEMLNQDIVDAILVPSNQAEYLPEIADSTLRRRIIRDLLIGDVLRALQESAAGTGRGLNIQWTLGSLRRPADRS